MRISAKRDSIPFEYEFLDGTTEKFFYLEPTTAMITESVSLPAQDLKEGFERAIASFQNCIGGDKDAIEKMVDELNTHGNIFEVRAELDKALGKHKGRS